MALPLIASIAALFVGPVLYVGSRTRAMAALVDGFALVAIGGLVIAHVLPQSFALAGWVVIPTALLGFFGPGLLCGSQLFEWRRAGKITIPLALTGIGLHALLDGVALSPEPGTGSNLLALAIVLHRIPVGLGLWWLARPHYGNRGAGMLLAFIALASVVGFFFGEALLAGTSHAWVAVFQAFVGGSLLHVILKHPPALPAARGSLADGWSDGALRAVSGLGGALGLVLMVGLSELSLESLGASHGGHGSHNEASLGAFVSLAAQSAPALLFAYVAVALVHAWMVDIRKFLGSGGRWSQSLRGTFAGLPLPVCSCGVIPLYRSLVHQRVPPSAAMSFLVATPELGFAALFLSWQLLGGPVTLARVGSAVVLALVVGLVVGRNAPVLEKVPAEVSQEQEGLSWSRRFFTGLRYGFGDMVDSTGPWIVVGLGLAAIAAPILDPSTFSQLPRFLEVPIFALIGMPLYVCASGSTPLVAVLIAKGVSPGAAIAFLLTGPATNMTTFGVLGRLHGRKVAVAFAAAVVLMTIGLGYAVNALPPVVTGTLPTVLHEHAPTAFQFACLLALAAAFGVSLFRQGTRGFVGQVISPHGGAHDHGDHDHDHGEDAPAAHSCCHAAPAEHVHEPV